MEKGIKETKELLTLGIQLGLAGKMAMADGKLSAADLSLVVKVFPYIGPAVEGIGEVPAELKDLDEAEGLELLAIAADLLPGITDNARLGNIVIKSLKVALAIGALISAIADKESKPEVTSDESNSGE